ncbi:MAG: hypothetical protein KIT77_20910 [Caldilinea sp.]|nr:hypothetical protein [Caldilinea sp.]MCB0058015.1 hypothetical protein [Caldilineaceae bacterium]MCB0066265.1 hypothetical protein [Caldilineaceae bacterium]MCB0138027.1 hypothetical protein [Caldilineaceae bacterium]MCB0148757.1 hypothetical protein [Caldilineaceae bacterium]
MTKQSKKKRKQAERQAKPVGGMALVARWPVYEVLVSATWRDTAQLSSVWIARRAPDTERTAVALMLVDLACLGVKSAQVKRFSTLADYEAFRERATGVQSMEPADLGLAAKILYTAIDYAAELGFKPDYVFNQAEYLLDGAQPEACTTPVPVGGPEGKPFFISGPYDDSERVIATLLRTVGEGNFHYLVSLGPDDIFEDGE